MRKNDNRRYGLKCDAIIYDEMVQFENRTTVKIKNQMKQERQKKKK
ncbi:hypothetical protein [Bacillus toyonensis]|nr:hypothetical protein [Bacillus toyonensis]